MKRLLIDAGNTNIKLAKVEGGRWQAQESVPTAVGLDMTRCLDVDEVWVSNVAGEAVGQDIVRACAPLPVHFIAAQDMQCGVRNGYAVPQQLGCDRWAALIYAWHHVGRACLVVSSGTATTVDALSGRGEFLGGLILPGIELMGASLGGAAANLRQCAGDYASFPRNTADAMRSGAIQASCGAIARQYELLGVPDAPVLLGGGAAPLLLQHLNLPAKIMDNPVLRGLSLIASEAGDA